MKLICRSQFLLIFLSVISFPSPAMDLHGYATCIASFVAEGSQLLTREGRVMRAAAGWDTDTRILPWVKTSPHDSPFVFAPNFRVARTGMKLQAYLIEEETGIFLSLEKKTLACEFPRAHHHELSYVDFPPELDQLLKDLPVLHFFPGQSESYDLLSKVVKEKSDSVRSEVAARRSFPPVY